MDREQKLDILRNDSVSTIDWKPLTPDEHGDWINQRTSNYLTLIPLTGKGGIFDLSMQGLKTHRDNWCYNSSENNLRDNIKDSIDFFNSQVQAFQENNRLELSNNLVTLAKSFVTIDDTLFHWDEKNFKHVASGTYYSVDKDGFRIGAYRPFFKQRLYFNQWMNVRIRKFYEIYPTPQTDNIGMYITGPSSNVPFAALMTNTVSDNGLISGNSAYLSLSRFVEDEPIFQKPEQSSKLKRVSNINTEILSMFRRYYNDANITEDALFFYTYGVLHSQQWRETFAADLAKSAVRIPIASTLEDFHAFTDAGRDLSELHLGYESVQPYPLKETYADGWDQGSSQCFVVNKMTYAGKRPNLDKTIINFNAWITLTDIPLKAHEYMLGTRSALDWLIDRYQVRTHKASGIVNDPNDWAEEVGDPRYILDLIKRITTVSLRTVDIVRGLPELPI